MKNILISEIIKLVNCTKNMHIGDQSIVNGTGWHLYRGEYKIHTHSSEFYILYFDSAATTLNISAAKQYLSYNPKIDRKKVHVIFAASISSLQTLQEFKRDVGGYWEAKEYVFSLMRSELEDYRNHILDLMPEDYVEPPIGTPVGIPFTNLNPLLSFFDDDSKGRLGVVLAEPGQGKTYQARYLCAILAKKGNYPVFVSSEQWKTMSVSDLSSIWKTISHSFRFVGSPIDWIDGNEDFVIKLAIKAGLFQIIFDGFDEYMSIISRDSDVREVISNLLDSVENEGSKIIVTSREAFWKAEVGDSLSGDNQCSNIFMYSINPFDRNSMRKYYKKKFGSEKEIEVAMGIFNMLEKFNDVFIGRGFVMYLIAELVKKGTYDFIDIAGHAHGGIIRWLFEALCEREIGRQGLKF
ncbi:MAG: NACHT domain-containing protein [Magnetococcales bacterium]|nr:NACHT domain-containing protein [Magnetococcales bacterium]